MSEAERTFVVIEPQFQVLQDCRDTLLTTKTEYFLVILDSFLHYLEMEWFLVIIESFLH